MVGKVSSFCLRSEMLAAWNSAFFGKSFFLKKVPGCTEDRTDDLNVECIFISTYLVKTVSFVLLQSRAILKLMFTC